MSFWEEFKEGLRFVSPVTAVVVDAVTDVVVSGLEWLLDVALEIVEWVFDAFLEVIDCFLSLGYKVISIFLPEADEYAKTQIKESEKLIKWANETIANTPQEVREKNKDLFARMRADIREAEKTKEKYTGEHEIYSGIIANGANEAIIPIINGRVDPGKTKVVNNTAHDPRIRNAHGDTGIQIYTKH